MDSSVFSNCLAACRRGALCMYIKKTSAQEQKLQNSKPGEHMGSKGRSTSLRRPNLRVCSRPRLKQVAALAQPHRQAHHQALAQRVYCRVGHLPGRRNLESSVTTSPLNPKLSPSNVFITISPHARDSHCVLDSVASFISCIASVWHCRCK